MYIRRKLACRARCRLARARVYMGEKKRESAVRSRLVGSTVVGRGSGNALSGGSLFYARAAVVAALLYLYCV